MNSVEQKLRDAIQAQGTVTHEDFIQTLDHREKIMLLDTVRELQKRGVLKRDISEKVEGRSVLKYVAVVPVTPTPPTPSGSVNNAPSA